MSPQKTPPADAQPTEKDPALEVVEAVALAVGDDPRAKITVDRFDPKTKDPRRVATFAPSEFSIEEVARRFGGGSYRTRIIDGGGKWMPGVSRFQVEGNPIAPRHIAPEPEQSAPVPPEPVEGQLMPLLIALIAGLTERQPAPPPVDPVATAAAIAAANAEQFKGMVEMLGLKSQPTPAADLASWKDAFQMGLDIGRSPEGSEDGFAAVAGPVASALTKLLDRTEPAAPPAPAVQPPQPQPAMQDHPLAQALAILIPAAEGGSANPEAWAGIVEEQIPGLADVLDIAVAQADGSVDRFLDSVAGFESRVGEHREFFRRVVLWLTATATDDEPTEDDELPDDMRVEATTAGAPPEGGERPDADPASVAE